MSHTAADFERAASGAADVARFEEPRPTFGKRLHNTLHAYPTIIPALVLFAAMGVFGYLTDGKFVGARNLSIMMQQISVIGILAIGQTLVILTAGIDLSIAAVAILSSVVMGQLAVDGMTLPQWAGGGVIKLPPPLAVLVGISVGALCGLINGLLVTRLRLPPFIVTLGTWYIFYAVNLMLSGSQSIRSQDIDAEAPLLKIFGERMEWARDLGRLDWLRGWFGDPAWAEGLGTRFVLLTYAVLLMIGLFAFVWYLLNMTAWGRHVYATGDDKDAAELSGVRSDRTLVSVYVLAGIIAGIAGWAAIGRFGAVSPTSMYEGNLQSITAVVIGGTSLFGGRGSIVGTLMGVLIVGVFSAGLKQTGVDVQQQLLVLGTLIIFAVAIDQKIRKVTS